MSYRSLWLAIAALSSMQVVSADAQSVYVAPGAVYIGAGPVYVTPAPNVGAYGYGPPAVVPPPPVVPAPTAIHEGYGFYYDAPLSAYAAAPPPRPPAPVPYAAVPYHGSNRCYYGGYPCY
jgi:hypothetical protein